MLAATRAASVRLVRSPARRTHATARVEPPTPCPWRSARRPARRNLVKP
ncbi:hypothetical protein [Allonocardiopsis opalescens]|nr:hypothetical protein [Allonocardiopsis opalescens]